MNQRKLILLGAHMSIARGVEQSIIQGESINCTAIQIFTASNRQWSMKTFDEPQITAFKNKLKNSPIAYVFSHASYLINLGSAKKETRDKSIEALLAELTRCAQLGLPYVVLHPGSAVGTNRQECIKMIATNLDYVLENAPSSTQILLENMAGQGSACASQFEDLAALYSLVTHKERIGFCFDTAHAFAAGYDFRTIAGYEAMWQKWDTLLGMKTLKAIHLNDSKKPLGSCVDRHEHIGTGAIGIDAFKFLMNDPRFEHIPKILETPKGEGLQEDTHNMQVLINLID
ncbi:MAG: deoxyribonuclease IV [Candidatus Babeliales bacterium]